MYLTRCVVLKTKVIKSSLLLKPQFPHQSKVVVAALISLVLLPDIWVREGATRTLAEEPHRYQRGAGHPARSVGWRMGSPLPSELGRDHPGWGSGALTLALRPPLPTEEITPTHTHLARPSYDRPRLPLVRASSHHTWVRGEDDPKRGPLTTGRPAPLSPPRLESLPSPHLWSLGRPVRPGSKARPLPRRG